MSNRRFVHQFLVRIPPGHFMHVERCNLLSSEGGGGGVALYEGVLNYGGCVSGLGSVSTPTVVHLLCGGSVYGYSSYNNGVVPLPARRRFVGPGPRVLYWHVVAMCFFDFLERTCF